MTVRLVKTCDACPEQYDAFLGQRRIGYLRLRHGHFHAAYPDAGGEVVYEAYVAGDGAFEEGERDRYLRFAAAALLKRHAEGPQPEPEPPAVDYVIES